MQYSFSLAGPTKTNTLSKQCSDWALSRVTELRAEGRAANYLLLMPDTKKSSGAKFLGSFTDAQGKDLITIPAWQYHIAVISDGKVYDEIHPQQGVPRDGYIKFFKDHDAFAISEHQDLEEAMKLANPDPNQGD